MREANQSRERIFNFNIHLLLILEPDSTQHLRVVEMICSSAASNLLILFYRNML
jgi:hypothetical protein